MSAYLVLAAVAALTLLTGRPATAQLDLSCDVMDGTRLRLRKLDFPLGGQRVLYRGRIDLVAGTEIEVAETGLRFRMTDDAGTVMADVTIPGNAGLPSGARWSGSRLRNAWVYSDRRGSLGGIQRILARRSPVGPGTLKVLVYGQNMTFAPPVRNVYVHIYLRAVDGSPHCGRRFFSELGCTYRNQGGKLNCH
ncbi:MAG: hypothetical protein KIT14_22315 [bacterium]|nr:hypothetical protein [bacterium]